MFTKSIATYYVIHVCKYFILQVDIDLIDPDMAFTLIPIGNTQAVQTLSGIDG